MTEFSERWLSRLTGVISGLNWLFLILGSVTAYIQHPETAPIAITLGAIYTVALQLMPQRLLRSPVWREATALGATGLTTATVVLTGTFDSGFLLLALTPVMLAALVGGYRLGLATAGLSGGILVAVAVSSQTPDYGGGAVWVGLVLLVAATFGLARGLLLEAMERVEVLTHLSATTGARLEHLENANILLTKLVELADADDLSPSNIATATLEGIRSAVPFNGASVYMKADAADISVAESGTATGSRTVVPIATSRRQIGALHLYSDRPLTERQLEIVRDLLSPTAVGFTNVELIEKIASAAIRDERQRIARELHDGIGPGLAALGLAIDVAAMDGQGAIEDQLRDLRSSVTELVTDVRGAVIELRGGETSSTTRRVHDATAGAQLTVTIDIAESTPVPGRRGENINAIIVEALRNAIQHSQADTLTVSAQINGHDGRVLIADNGIGFDPDGTYEGHFGIIGMRERATEAAANLRMDSSPTRGTTILLEWKPL